MRRADVAADHYRLVVAKMKLKLRKHWTTGETAFKRFNTAFSRDADKLNGFKKALNNNSFQALQDLLQEDETTMEGNLRWIKTILTPTC
ncbi:unnamed protein product [Schistosoma curassoni]|uniref:DDE_Tnp_ISL3 domain-containing protein n=1 Tax=Schistosoma curassoni TaxID=6186 RepID=A0A183KPT7_9TREM|nr:unnamed protein product [Schistosoma curassoni]